MDTQRVDHYLKQHGGATYGPFYETTDGPFYEATCKCNRWTILLSKTEKQGMDHFMKQNCEATCVTLYGATRTETQRIYNFMMQKENAKDGPFYEAKLENTG